MKDEYACIQLFPNGHRLSHLHSQCVIVHEFFVQPIRCYQATVLLELHANSKRKYL